jgi:aarF domain-containing kinase
MTENEDVDLVMRALRGTNMNDDDTQIQGLQMQLVDVGMGDDTLPLYYDPVALKKFFSKRPLAVLTRIFQLTSVGGKVVFSTAIDAALGRIQGNPDLEVKRAAELRDTITSLGPMFIKLGQALSIRPDVLSPRSMVELQKLCDKVPSYPSDIAFQTIQDELGRSVDEIFSEITPEPVGEFHSKRVFSRLEKFQGSIRLICPLSDLCSRCQSWSGL